MKKITIILFIALAAIITSCEGPMGPPGLPGNDGEDGFIGTTFEFTDDFTAANDYELIFNFEDNGYIPYESDVVLTYISWKNEDGLDYWRPLPQTHYFESGAILQYNFDFTADIPNDVLVDMAVFLEGDIDLSTLPTSYTLDQKFRIVVVPSDFLALKSVDVSDINSILQSPQLKLNTIKGLKFTDLESTPEIQIEK
jgi:hypothetical protein